MFIQWDRENQTAIGLPNNKCRGDDWLPYQQPPRRQSRSQTLAYTLGYHHGIECVFGDWIGSSDPMDEQASNAQIKDARNEILNSPIEIDGNVFQFDRDSRDIMDAAYVGLQVTGGTVDWRLLDNSTITLNAVQLNGYISQLRQAQAVRGFQIDQQYLAFKANGATLGDLDQWKRSYLLG